SPNLPYKSPAHQYVQVQQRWAHARNHRRPLRAASGSCSSQPETGDSRADRAGESSSPRERICACHWDSDPGSGALLADRARSPIERDSAPALTRARATPRGRPEWRTAKALLLFSWIPFEEYSGESPLCKVHTIYRLAHFSRQATGTLANQSPVSA